MNLKLHITGVSQATSKDGKDLYFIKCRDDVYVQELEKYVGGVSFFTDKATYDRIVAQDDSLVVRFNGARNVTAE